MADWTPAVGAAKTPPDQGAPQSTVGWTPAVGGIMNAQMKKSAFAQAQEDSPLWQGVKGGRAIQTGLEATGHPYLAKGMKNLTDLTEAGTQALTGLGSGVAQTVYGGMHALTQYAPKDSFIGQLLDTGVRRGLGLSVGAGESSPLARTGHDIEQTGEYFVNPFPEIKGLEQTAKTGGVIKRPLAAAARDALKVLPVAHAQSGGDFSRSLPNAAIAGVLGGAGGLLGAVYDKFSGMTQDIHPERIAAANFAKSNEYGPIDPKTGQPTPQTVTVDPATRTGSTTLKHTKKALASGINAPAAENLENLQSDEYGVLGEKMGENFGLPRTPPGAKPPAVPPKPTPAMEPIQTGQSGYSALDKVREGHSADADQAYGGARAFTQMLPDQTIPVSTWQMTPTGQTSQLTGQPIAAPAQVVVNRTFKVPVDRSQLAAAMKKFLNNQGTITQAKLDANPALQMIHDVVYGDSVVEAERALQDLSALYKQAKLDKGQFSANINQFLSSNLMQNYRQTVDRDIASISPHLLDLYNEGRASVGKQHAIGTLINRIVGKIDPETPYSPSSLSPVEFFQGLVRRKDTAFPLLQQFAQEAPDEVRHVASTVFQGLLEAAAKGEKSFSSARSARSMWNQLGDQTKELLFPGKVGDIDNFFKLGEFLAQNPQPSNTGVHLLMTARLTSLLTNTGLFAKDTGIEYVLGKYMFSNGGALPYMRQITPGVFRINPASVGAASIFHKLTGIDPKIYSQPQPKPPVESTPKEGAAEPGKPIAGLNVNSDGSAAPGLMARLGDAAGRVLRSDIRNPEYPPGEQYIRNTASRNRPGAPPLTGNLTDPGILHRAEMERQLAHPQGIVDATTGPLIQAVQQTPMGQVATAGLRMVAKPSDALNVFREMNEADVPMIGKRPELRTNITAQDVLAEAAKGTGKFGGFSKYIERNPTAGEQLFDTTNAQPALPGRPPVPRYDPTIKPARGYSQRAIDAFANPKVINGLKRYIRMGAKELPQDWYANDPLFKEYQKEWGPQAEEKYFQQMAYQAATSQGASVPDNQKIGSLYNYLHEQNLEFPKLVAGAEGEKPKLNIPPSYGHDKQLGHLRTAETFRDTGAIDALGNPKRASFTENLMGSEDALTADRHFMRLIGMLSEDPRFLKTTAVVSRGGQMVKVKAQQLFKEGKLTMQEALADPNLWEDRPNANEYLYLEKMFRDKIAKPLKLTVADSQGKAWVGARKLTGMDSPVNTWVNVLRQRIQYTADRLGADPQVILKKFVKGEIPLLQLGAAAAGLGALGTMSQGDAQKPTGAMQ